MGLRPEQAVSASLLALLATLLLSGCFTIERQIEITPEAVPEEFQNAAWEDLPVSYCVVPNEEGLVGHDSFIQMIERAFQQWGVEVQGEGTCSSEQRKGNGRNEIAWGNLGSGEGSITEAGETSVSYRRCALCRTPEIVEADIVIDVNPPRRMRSEACLYTTILHETGHFLGVHHLPSPAVMAPVLSGCPQELTQADLEAIAALYQTAISR
jgi:hypothetical protein